LDLEAWYLVPELDPEPKIALHWLDLNGLRAIEENLVTELPLDRLHSRSSVYVLCRKPFYGDHGYGIRPSQPIISETDGLKGHVHASHRDLATDMKAYGPIVVKEHWVSGVNKFNSKLNRGTFMESFGKMATPWAPAWKDMTRRDGDLPSILYLRSA
jgi:hypothetical protein